MKHTYSLLLGLALSPMISLAQAYNTIDLNDVRARFYSHGLVGMDLSTSTAAFEVPQGSDVRPLYSAGLWIDGISPDSQLRLAAMKYEPLGEADYFPGPLTTDGSASTNASIMAQYDHVWKITRAEVLLHEAYFECLIDPDCDISAQFPDGYTIPQSFYDWPAINPTPGFDTYFAPFFDFNGDGGYDPGDGDAPCIEGDEALYFVFNDKGGVHMNSGGGNIGIEVKAMPFVYHTGNYLDQVLFIRYHIVNQGTQTLTQARIGWFNDFDLGCSEDDFIGCDMGRNLTYVYNQDDDDASCNGASGYGVQPPAFGQVLLKGSRLDADGTDNLVENLLPSINGSGFDDGIVDNERSGIRKFIAYRRDGPSCCNDPVLAAHYANYLRGIWKDGEPLSYGGSGYAPSDPNAVDADLMYPDSSDPSGASTAGQPQSPWVDADLIYPDRRGVTSMEPFTFEPGERIDLLVAYVYARAASGGPMASLQALKARVDSVRTFANTLPMITESENLPWMYCSGTGVGMTEQPRSLELNLFPVPAQDELRLIAPPDLSGSIFEIRDALGRSVRRQQLIAGLNTVPLQGLSTGRYVCFAAGANGRYVAPFVKE